jgi:hypothetical protein
MGRTRGPERRQPKRGDTKRGAARTPSKSERTQREARAANKVKAACPHPKNKRKNLGYMTICTVCDERVDP